jgi:hypothetical protein
MMTQSPGRLAEPMAATHPTKAGLRVSEWVHDTGLSRAYVYNLLRDKKIASVKSGTARIITTPPVAYLKNLAG